MEEYVLIGQLIAKPEKIDLAINSKHTCLNAKLICSFGTRNTDVLTYESNRFNLYEGEQWLSFRHAFSNISIQGVMLTIKVVNQNDVQVGKCCRFLQNEFEQKPSTLIKVTGDINRITKGGNISIEIAGIACKVHTHYNENLQSLENYITTKEPVCEICVAEKEIQKELLNRTHRFPPTEAAIEMYTLRNMVSELLVDYNCFRIHGAALAVDQRGYIFTANSGTGKTTHMQLWLKNYQNAYIVNGDQPIVQVGQDIKVCGSPWCGKEGYNTNIAVPLKAIVIMERSTDNAIVEISMGEALAELIHQTYRPSDATKMRKTLQLLSLLDGKIKFYRFRFNNFADDAFSVSYRKIHLGQ